VGNFAHEHLEFYSLASLEYLLARHGLLIFRVEENAVNGGSYRIYVQHADGPYQIEESLHDTKRTEQGMGLDRPGYYDEWFRQMRQNRDRCVDFIRREVANGKKVWVYGASTKGNVILQWYDQSEAGGGFDAPVRFSSLITAAADRSPEKVGRVMVGTGIPILQEANFRQAAPDYALVLPYAFREEFLEREKEWRDGGGKFIFPLPEFEVV
jgi:hypothetical protein